MWTLLFFLSAFRAASGDCPDWFDIVRDGVCVGPVGSVNCNNNGNQNCIASRCVKNDKVSGLSPPLKALTIHTEKEQSYWTGQSASTEKSIFLALACNKFTDRWEWYDGSIVNFKPYNNYNKYYMDQNCTLHSVYSGTWYMNYTGFWQYSTDRPTNFESYCIGQLPPLSSKSSCDDFSKNVDNDLCYQVRSTPANWTAAQTSCQQLGAELASIHSQQENDFIRDLAVTQGAANGLFLGAKSSEDWNGTEWAWADGSEWDFDSNYEGYPIGGEGECLMMDSFSFTGQWQSMDCSSKLPYVCARQDKASVCPSGPLKEGELITSPGFPYDASIPCDYKLSVAPGKFVQVEIEDLQANSCCDNLLIADGKITGKLIAKLSGQIVGSQPKTFNSASNVMRVSWQPKGGVNVKGFRMKYRAVDNANEGPLTTTHKPTTTISTTTVKSTTGITTDDKTSTTSTATTSTSTTVKPTTSGVADYGVTFIISAILAMVQI